MTMKPLPTKPNAKLVAADKASRAARLQGLKDRIRANTLAGRDTYEGLTSAEIGEHSRAIMFGDNDEAFPSQEEWSRVVD